jgi:hypothetical protein
MHQFTQKYESLPKSLEILKEKQAETVRSQQRAA